MWQRVQYLRRPVSDIHRHVAWMLSDHPTNQEQHLEKANSLSARSLRKLQMTALDVVVCWLFSVPRYIMLLSLRRRPVQTVVRAATLRWKLFSVPATSYSLRNGRAQTNRPAVNNGKQVGAICSPHGLQRRKGHPKKELRDRVKTTSRRWDRRGQHPPAGQNSSSHNH